MISEGQEFDTCPLSSTTRTLILIQSERPFVFARTGGVLACQGWFSGERPLAGWAQGTVRWRASGGEFGVEEAARGSSAPGASNCMGPRQKVSGIVKLLRLWRQKVGVVC